MLVTVQEIRLFLPSLRFPSAIKPTIEWVKNYSARHYAKNPFLTKAKKIL